MNTRPVLERFYDKVLFTTDCWEWQGHIIHNGYGQFGLNSKVVGSHRFAYELYNGKIPQGMTVDHLCRNRKCCNPEHLEIVTNKENILRGIGITAINSKKTHCKRGHPLSGDNLYKYKNMRECKKCSRQATIDYRKRMK